MEIACQANSRLLTPSDLAYQTRAVNTQMEQHWAPAYLEEPWPMRSYDTLVGLPSGTFWPLAIIDDIGAKPGVSGFHDFIAGLALSRVLANENPLDATTLSHEGLEMRADAYCNIWIQMPDGRWAAREVCDPCEADRYPIEVTIGSVTKSILVSDFVLPAWFVAGAPGPYSYLDTIDEPFGLSRNGGGYRLLRDVAGNIASDFGQHQPTERAGRKYNDTMSRMYRRLHS